MVKCAVIGCGLMGCKIAGMLAYNGHRVKMFDSNIAVLNSVYERIKEDRNELLREGLLLQPVFPGQILCMSRLDETVEDSDFVFEAIIDDLTVKQDIFEQIDRYTKEDTILATNTLRLDVDLIMERVEHKERVLGLRFLFPVYEIPEVEYTPSSKTSTQAINKSRDLLEKMGKTLFFRSGVEPLILTEEQRDERRRAFQQQLLNTSCLGRPASLLPSLSASSTTLSRHSNGPGFGLVSESWPINNQGLSGLSNTYNVTECAICLDRPRDCLLEKCRHLVLCRICADLLHSRQDFCPLCRQKIDGVIEVYLS